MRDKIEEIQEAIEKKHCPYCKDEHRNFWVDCWASQELWLDEKGNTDWGDVEIGSIPHSVSCGECGKEIPKEIWEKWLSSRR